MRGRWLGALAGIPVLAIGLLFLKNAVYGHDPELRSALLRWLTCDDCSNGERVFVADTLGPDAAEVLEEFLRDPAQPEVIRMEEALRDAVTTPGSPFENLVSDTTALFANGRATVRRRATLSLIDLQEREILRKALEDRDQLDLDEALILLLREAVQLTGDAVPGLISPTVGSVSLRPPTLALQPGTEGVLQVIVLDTEGNQLQLQDVNAIASPDSVASVTASGTGRVELMARGVGQATVRASAGDVTGEATIVVSEPPRQGSLVLLSGNGQQQTPGNALRPLVVRVLDADGHGLSQVRVTFTVVRGSAHFPRTGPAAPQDTVLAVRTDSDGVAQVGLIMRGPPGPVWVAAEAPNPPLPLRPRKVRFVLRTIPG